MLFFKLNLAIFLDKLICWFTDFGAFISKKENKGAAKKIVNINAIAMPIDTKLPKSRSGGTSRTLNERNPMQVVKVVRKRGCKFNSKLLTIDSLLECPLALC